MNGRTQCVSVDGVKSEWKRATSSIPKALFWVLFCLIFINDMPNEVKNNICKLFGTANCMVKRAVLGIIKCKLSQVTWKNGIKMATCTV